MACMTIETQIMICGVWLTISVAISHTTIGKMQSPHCLKKNPPPPSFSHSYPTTSLLSSNPGSEMHTLLPIIRSYPDSGVLTRPCSRTGVLG